MSYDIELVGEDGEVLKSESPHQLRGGTYQVGGSQEAWLNITYNYAPFFHQTLGEKGIRTIYGMKAMDSLPLLIKAICELKDDMSDNYWDATEGNARQALLNLVELAKMFPEGVWDGD